MTTTRDRLLDEAEALFARTGVAAVTTRASRTMPDTKKRAAALLLERSKTLQSALEKDVSKKDELVAVQRAVERGELTECHGAGLEQE